MPPHLYPGFNATIHTHPQTAALTQLVNPAPVGSTSSPVYPPSPSQNGIPSGSQNAQKLYKGHLAQQLHTLCACAQTANGAGVTGSAAVLKDRLKDLLVWHLSPETCPEQLKLVLEESNIKDSFGALLDRLADTKEKCELESDEKREAIIKKAEDDKRGGEAIRQASLITLCARSQRETDTATRSPSPPSTLLLSGVEAPYHSLEHNNLSGVGLTRQSTDSHATSSSTATDKEDPPGTPASPHHEYDPVGPRTHNEELYETVIQDRQLFDDSETVDVTSASHCSVAMNSQVVSTLIFTSISWFWECRP
ncbi:hypothetical protein K435DRAFT_874793 [Dendrothele bispora CBS 962.96]|uniref:Uncharacterized protein n=1 Tax=Dendrothele bispora (strain CBS 962.96) TaxID=1314807 RepID=A0A4V4HBN7_DENBC|nr:hypothetical protein K435DRAFT_874793 [Dendrothele bispora CBS 962.96]